MKAAHVLLVDGDRVILNSMSHALRQLGCHVQTESSLRQAVASIEATPPDVVVTEVSLADGSGFDLLRKLRAQSPDIPVVLITGYGTVEYAVAAVRDGAFDYLTKPIRPEELKAVIDRALAERPPAAPCESAHEPDELAGLDNIVGRDFQMMQLYELIESVADTRTTVLITGESGTGKTLTARAIHRRSSRRGRAFVEVACGALPETLLESELFGHKAGSFTGAIGDKVGKFQLADGGTIFLDEIATASPSLQVKLLRVLQNMEFEAVGGTETRRVDARVVLATNQDLAELVAARQFRQDLYYRINVVTIHLPPLRERTSDVPLLAVHFLKQFNQQNGRHFDGFSIEAMEIMQRYSWPGNIRELENVVERAVVLSKGPLIQPNDLPPLVRRAGTGELKPAGGALKEAMQAPERSIIEQALEKHGWNRQETAAALGINRTTLYKKMKRYGLMDERRCQVV